MHNAPAQNSAPLATPAGLVDADTAAATDVVVWDDAAAVRVLLLSRDTSIQRPRQRDTAA